MSDPDPLERALGHRFQDRALRETALAHPSWSHEREEGSRGNERLEYLGDAVLGLAVAHLLYQAHGGWHEGDLTRARAALVNKRALAERARALELGPFVKLGRTEELTGGEEKDSVLANALEALIGAVYLDAGFEAAAGVVERVFADGLDGAPRRDAKTELQEWAHAARRGTPRYRTVGDSGVEDDEQRFTVEVEVGAETLGRGIGRSKRLAERAAARDALRSRETSAGG